MVKTAILVSGGGTNLQSIIDSRLFGELPQCELTAVISSDPQAYALQRAKNAQIPAYVVDREVFPNHATYSTAILQMLQDLDIELVVLAGYTQPLEGAVLQKFRHRIINTFPSLLPKYSQCDPNTLAPYEAAIRAGETVSGATVYFVTGAEPGPVILQRQVSVLPGDTPSRLQRRITEQAEWQLLPQAIALFCTGRLQIAGDTVTILDE